ncbi:ATP-binding cassette subfamily C [Candidatus Terasakiella magnetica]|nr:ATP-binding cassette subfamily C [Candidatus Terasakiella magnetica]
MKNALIPEWLPGEMTSLRRAFVSHPRSVGVLSGFRRYLPDLIAVSLVLNLLGLALPLTLLQVYDRILPSTATDTLTALAIGIVVAVTLETALRITRSAVTGWTSGRFEHLAATRAFQSLLNRPIDEFERKGTGAHLESLNSIHTLKDFYAGQAFLSVFDLPFAVIYLLLMLAFGGWLVLVPMLLMAMFTLAGLIMGRTMMEAIRRRIAADDSRVNFIIEVLSGIHTIKALAMEAQMMRRHERLLENSSDSEFAVAELSAKGQSMALLFSHLTTILVVAFGSIQVIDGQMTTGVLAACSLLAGRCIQPMQAALDRWTRFQTARLAEERLNTLLDSVGSDTAPQAPAMDNVEGALTLEGVGLRFGEAQTVLDSLDLEIQAGEMIGISGENGVGKSSLLGVMAGLVEPTSGRVLVDGRALAGFDPHSARQVIAYISQRPELFRGTILENMNLFDPARSAVAKQYARDLGIDRFVARLPLGYETMVGEGSSESLPRGLRQLIAIVRALAQEPRIILFDEANTAVDGAGDQALRAVFEALQGKATVVLMTSRPSMLSLASRTFKLIDGRLVDAKSIVPQQRGGPEPVPLAAAAAARQTVQAGVQGRPGLGGEGIAERIAGRSGDFIAEVERASALGRCLLPLLNAMRWTGDLRHLAEALPHFEPRLDIVAFRNVMANLGYGNEPAKMSGEPIDSRVLPCLFIDYHNSPMVLTSSRPEGVVALLADGTEKLVPLSQLYGTAYFFTALDGAEYHGAAGHWFKHVVARFHGLIWALLGQSLIINLLSLGVPLFTMSVYDKVISTGDVGMLVAFLCGVLIVIAGDEVLRELRAKASAYVGARISYIVSTMVFERTLLLPLALTERASIGSQLARFKDLESFRDFFGGGIAAMLIDMPFVVVYLIVMVMLGGVTAMVPVVALAIFALVVAAAMPVVRRRVAGSGRSVTRRQELVVETLLKMRSIRYSGMEKTWADRFRDICAEAAMAGYESSLLTGVLASLSQAMVVLSGMATMIVGVYQVLNNGMSPGALIASMMVVWRILAPMQTGFSLVQRIEQTRSSIRQLEALASFRTEGDGTSATSAALDLKGAVTFTRVSLRYSNDSDPALLGVSFDVEPGQVVAIVGPDGAGKSTILKLIAGLYAPQAGNVMIDDLDIRQIDPIELRKSIGYAPQVPQLFFGTIAQNLRLAQPTASDTELRHALTLAGVWDEVAALARGINTRVGDAATNRISTSLAQGISLARAYLKKSPLILLDEPVTGLDFDGDKCFRDFVEAMRGKATMFIVTHRPSHLSLADVIVVLEKGAVRAAGPAAEIRAKLA